MMARGTNSKNEDVTRDPDSLESLGSHPHRLRNSTNFSVKCTPKQPICSTITA